MDRQVVEVPTSSWRPGEPARLAAIEGVLSGGMASCGNYCVWIDDEGLVTPVIWPAGFRARLDPLELLDAGGQVVAREGDHLRVGGSYQPVQPDESCMFERDLAFSVQSEVAVIRPRP